MVPLIGFFYAPLQEHFQLQHDQVFWSLWDDYHVWTRGPVDLVSGVSLQLWWSRPLASVGGDVCCLLMAVVNSWLARIANASGHLPESLGRSFGDVSMRLIQREANRRVSHSFLRCEGLLGLGRCCRLPVPGKRCNRTPPVTCYNWWSCAATCTPTWSMLPAHRALLPCSLALPPPCSDLFLEKLLSLLRRVFFPSNEILETF